MCVCVCCGQVIYTNPSPFTPLLVLFVVLLVLVLVILVLPVLLLLLLLLSLSLSNRCTSARMSAISFSSTQTACMAKSKITASPCWRCVHMFPRQRERGREKSRETNTQTHRHTDTQTSTIALIFRHRVVALLTDSCVPAGISHPVCKWCAPACAAQRETPLLPHGRERFGTGARRCRTHG